MAFLVRKLNKMDDIFSLNREADVLKIYADIPTTEFRTKKGTLSTWLINSLDEIENAILAIAITSSEITKMDFIIIDTKIIIKNDLAYKQTYAGQDIAVPDLQDTHYDIFDITIEKIVNCTKVYQEIVKEDPNCNRYIIRYAAGDIKNVLKKAIQDKRIDENKLSKRMKEQLDKLKAS